MAKVYLSLGSNIGDRIEYIDKAIDKIKVIENCVFIEKSKIYETKPLGNTEQDSFLNICLLIECELEPKELLINLQAIELSLDRTREIYWGPRTIDIDILLFDNIIFEDEDLIIPHPRLTQRGFNLIPLSDLNRNLVINGQNIIDLIKKIDISGIKEYTNNDIRDID